jgi:hypothetical protein
MLITIRRLNLILVDRIVESPWLRDRAGANASWAPAERHARAWRKAHDRHARTHGRHAASSRAARGLVR